MCLAGNTFQFLGPHHVQDGRIWGHHRLYIHCVARPGRHTFDCVLRNMVLAGRFAAPNPDVDGLGMISLNSIAWIRAKTNGLPLKDALKLQWLIKCTLLVSRNRK